jgi:hypothetical protein
MLITALTLMASAMLAPTAHANFNYYRFQSPSGDVVCVMLRGHNMWDQPNYGKGDGTCQVRDPAYQLPPRQYVGADGQTSTCYLASWGTQFALPEGHPPHLTCAGGELVGPPLETLEYGQAKSVGAITCASEPTAMTCTDTSSGHFFRVSRDAYELG